MGHRSRSRPARQNPPDSVRAVDAPEVFKAVPDVPFIALAAQPKEVPRFDEERALVGVEPDQQSPVLVPPVRTPLSLLHLALRISYLDDVRLRARSHAVPAPAPICEGRQWVAGQHAAVDNRAP